MNFETFIRNFWKLRVFVKLKILLRGYLCCMCLVCG